MIDTNRIYLISSGCSYCLKLGYIKNKIGEKFTDDYATHHNLGVSSSSIDYTKNATIDHISYLLRNDVPSKNIILFTNITQIGRICKKIPNDIWYYIKDMYSISNQTNYGGNVFTFYDGGFISINSDFYTFFIQSDNTINSYPKIVKEWFFNQINAHKSLDFITHIKNYVEDILTLQTFLEKNKIEYYFYFMNNTFEGWYYDNDDVLRHKYSSHNDYELPNLNEYLNISDIDFGVKSIYDLLNFKKFILYKNYKQNFGGLDEYCSDNYDKGYFLDHDRVNHTNCMIGCHPNDSVGHDFEKKYLYPKWLEFHQNLLKK
jgi:hypothetical protein